jgi:YHS domain-containing protein
MAVELARSTLFTTHRGITYHFCSAQCLERFNDIPALYTGPQRIADIRPIPKRRKLRLAAGKGPDLQRACLRVGAMMGVSKVVVEDGCLLLEYDLRQTVLCQIEAVAASEGLKFEEGFHGFRRRLWKYLEAGELENAAHPSTGACCNRPPVRLR